MGWGSDDGWGMRTKEVSVVWAGGASEVGWRSGRAGSVAVYVVTILGSMMTATLLWPTISIWFMLSPSDFESAFQALPVFLPSALPGKLDGRCAVNFPRVARSVAC